MSVITKNIYLADDDPDDREFFQIALESVCPDCRLVTSKNGDELLDQLQKNSTNFPDFIFLDINMPKKNGLESLEDIKGTIAFSSIPVIMFSTSDNQNHVHAAEKLGAALYMVKPSDFRLMQNRLSDIISSKDFKLKQGYREFLVR